MEGSTAGKPQVPVKGLPAFVSAGGGRAAGGAVLGKKLEQQRGARYYTLLIIMTLCYQNLRLYSDRYLGASLHCLRTHTLSYVVHCIHFKV